MKAKTKQTTAKLAISLLGAPRIDLNGEPVALPRRKTRSLLYFLAAAPGGHSRDELVELFWPNLDQARAKRQLSDALSDLRRTLGRSVISADTERVSWNGPEPDSVIFTNAIDQAARSSTGGAAPKLSVALDLYSGEFLSGVRADDSESFEEWLQELRLTLNSTALGGFARLAAIKLDDGEPAAAIEIAQRGLQLDNLREDLWRIIIQAHADMGDRPGSLAEYTRCRETLQRELGVSPEAETEALRRRISAEPGTPASGATESAAAKAKPPLPFPLRLPGSSLALVGRDRELGSLLRAWESARDGTGGLVAITGEPGIGKSRLAAEFASRAAAGGAVALAARCPGLTDPPPYGPIEEAIRGILPSMTSGAFSRLGDEWLPWVGRLLPELGLGVEAPNPVSPDGEKALLAEAAGRAFEVIAGDRPLLLIVEDIHWAHPATIVLLHGLARRGRPMLVLATIRDTEPQTDGTQAAQRVLADLDKEGLATTISLGALGMGDTEELVRLAIDSAGNGGRANAGAVAKLAEGQPLFALELTRAVLESPDDPDLPESLTNAIRLRIERSSEFAQRILELAAVFGRPVTLQLLGRAVGTGPSDESLVSAGEELVARRLLQEDQSGEMSLTHGLIHAAVYKSLSVSRRRALHSRAAGALESGSELPPGVRSEALARHYRLAGDLEKAVEHLIAAAQRANALGEVDTAEARYRAAADLLLRQGRDREAAEALECAADSLIQGCEIFGSAGRFREALAIWERIPGSEEALGRLHTRLAELCARWGWGYFDPEEIRRHVETAIQYVESDPDRIPREDRARAFAARSIMRSLLTNDYIAALEDATEALPAADGFQRVWLVAKDAECVALMKCGRLEDALESTLEKVPVAQALGDYFELDDAYAMAYIFCSGLGDAAAAEKYARLEFDAGKRSRLDFRGLISGTNLADALVAQGRFEEAEQLLSEHPGAPELKDYGPAEIQFARRNVLMSEICARRGDLRSARRFLSSGERLDELVRNDALMIKGCLNRARDALRAASKRKKASARV